MNPLAEQFVVEARELIAQATDALIGIEREGVGAEHMDRLLRAFHTLKGSAGLVGIPAMTLTMHAAEDLIAGIQDRRVDATPAVITQALACLDLVARWVDAFEVDGELPPQAGTEARAMSELLRGPLSPAGSGSGLMTSEGLPQWVEGMIAANRREISLYLGSRPVELVAVSYQPHAGCFFDGDDPLRLLREIPGLLALRVEGPPRDRISELDPFACQLRFYAIAEGPRDRIASVFRQVPDQVRILDLPTDALRPSPGKAVDASRAIVEAVIREQREMLQAAGKADSMPGRIGAAARSASNALRHAGLLPLAEAVSTAGDGARANSDPAALLAALERALIALAEQPGSPLSGATAAGTESHDDAASRWLRVPEARIDALVNLAGELIVLKNSFAHLARRVDAEGGADLSRAMKREQEGIERLAGDFHDAILDLRMVPVGQLFRSLPRLVRDLSLRLQKQVQLAIRGETTESDKAVVDRLFEPLLHVVRNALDHGIEAPDARVAAGKTATGCITIAASRIGDRMVLEITDDGRGIDPAALKREAEERGVAARETLAELSDEQALELIFAAGISTAAEITEISGRGVGMDVVRQTVEQIGGRLSVASRPGAGTTVRLDVPISIATARIMVVEAAGQRFGIAMDAVTETVRVGPDRIRAVKDNEGFVLRDRIVPICSLAELMDLPGRSRRDAEARLLVVVEVGAKIAAVEVDAIRDRLDAVLKPMQGLLSTARGYAGTTMLGDGSVLLVLDVKEILP